MPDFVHGRSLPFRFQKEALFMSKRSPFCIKNGSLFIHNRLKQFPSI